MKRFPIPALLVCLALTAAAAADEASDRAKAYEERIHPLMVKLHSQAWPTGSSCWAGSGRRWMRRRRRTPATQGQ